MKSTHTIAGKHSLRNEAECTSAGDHVPRLLWNTKEVCVALGGIHPRTLARLEARGLIRPVSGLIRHKLYARRDVEALVENLSSWKP